MRQITKTYNICKFNELAEDLQKKLIEQEIKSQNEFYCEACLQEDMQEEAERLLYEYFDNHAKYRLSKSAEIKTWYSLCYCQGDGSMIEFTLIDKKTEEEIKIKHNGYYYHEYSFIIDHWNILSYEEEKELKEEIVTINKKLTKYGYGCIENYETEEEAKEYLSEHEFYETGEFYE